MHFSECALRYVVCEWLVCFIDYRIIPLNVARVRYSIPENVYGIQEHAICIHTLRAEDFQLFYTQVVISPFLLLIFTKKNIMYSLVFILFRFIKCKFQKNKQMARYFK